jgi:hypothetical protein
MRGRRGGEENGRWFFKTIDASVSRREMEEGEKKRMF